MFGIIVKTGLSHLLRPIDIRGNKDEFQQSKRRLWGEKTKTSSNNNKQKMKPPKQNQYKQKNPNQQAATQTQRPQTILNQKQLSRFFEGGLFCFYLFVFFGCLNVVLRNFLLLAHNILEFLLSIVFSLH